MSGRSPYSLRILFTSNSAPWQGTHDAYKIFDDAEAIEWARGMQEGMGGCYTITLLKNGEVMKFEKDEACR